ncbi:9155_t:CDS:2 [Paraglomus brasilianum]|uniref:9155_t:CDS:1 n=1 Tax=Paraglomus brasilianum TaxID=144538 RepID=A0A9N9GJL4_9GLOM|nr:9155_t:CDS:2 [Paraglomus brasilianum]
MAQMAQSSGQRPTKRQILGAIKKLINLFKNLSADEVLVAKEKGKSLATEYLTNAVLDEELLAEMIKLTAEGSEILLKNFSPEELESFVDISPSTLAKNGEKINQALQRKFDNSNISSAEEQSIIKKLSNPRQLSGTGNSSENTGTGLTFLSPANAFGSIKVGPDSLSEEQF